MNETFRFIMAMDQSVEIIPSRRDHGHMHCLFSRESPGIPAGAGEIYNWAMGEAETSTLFRLQATENSGTLAWPAVILGFTALQTSYGIFVCIVIIYC